MARRRNPEPWPDTLLDDDTARARVHEVIDGKYSQSGGRHYRPDLGELIDQEVITLTPQQLAGFIATARQNFKQM